MRKNQGSAHLLLLVVLLIGLVIAVFLVGKQTVFRNRAASTPPTTTDPSLWGNAMSLDGNSYIKVASSSGLNPRLGFTAEAWIKPTNPIFTSRIISKMNSTENSFSILIISELNNGNYLVTYQFGATDTGLGCGYRTVMQQQTLNSGQVTAWQHVAGVIQSDGKMDIFVNGQRSTINTNFLTKPCLNSTVPVTIGARELTNGVDGYFPGQIDEVRISNVARYTANFTVPSSPNTADYTNDYVLYHFDSPPQCNVLTKECFTNNYTYGKYDGQLLGNVSFVPSTIPVSTPPPVPATYKTCQVHACAVVQGIGIDSCQSDSNCNQSPVANFTYVSTPIGKNSVTVQFTNKSTDPDGDTLTYSWNFGDGTTSTLNSPSHTYKRNPKQRSYTATLTTKDGYGGSATISKTIPIF